MIAGTLARPEGARDKHWANEERGKRLEAERLLVGQIQRS